jgi:hypothetical protein
VSDAEVRGAGGTSAAALTTTGAATGCTAAVVDTTIGAAMAALALALSASSPRLLRSLFGLSVLSSSCAVAEGTAGVVATAAFAVGGAGDGTFASAAITG